LGVLEQLCAFLEPHHATIARDVPLRRRAAATIVERLIRDSAQCGGYTERCPVRRSLSYAFAVFQSVRPQTGGSVASRRAVGRMSG
jgi:hypothetical protein